MFKRTAGNSVSSDSGFKIQIIAIWEIKYAEGDKVLKVDIEAMVGEPSMAVYKSSIKNWEAPHAHEVLTPEKKAEIMNNISEALRFLKINFKIS